MVTSRIWFTASQKIELWERWKQGQSISAISRALERRNKTGVQRIVALHGGIAPLPRRRSVSALRLEEREEISRGIAAGRSIRWIARTLGRSPSTICREIGRNGGLRTYRAARADKQAWERALRPKRCHLALHGRLRWRVAQKLALQWSPQQIAGWLKRQYPGDPGMQISHEAIYRSLFIQARGVLKKELMAHLRTRRQMRLAKGAKTDRGHGQIVDMVSIRERPAEAEDRAVPGHWEGDMLTGTNDTHIATLVERHSRFTMLVKLKRKDSATVVAALAQQIGKLPVELRRSLTWDQGKEMARHECFTMATNIQVYFCDPRSPWQRGSNENTNGLLRQYSRAEPIYPGSLRPSSTPSPLGSINGRAKPWTLKHPPIHYGQCCNDPLNPPVVTCRQLFPVSVGLPISFCLSGDRCGSPAGKRSRC